MFQLLNTFSDKQIKAVTMSNESCIHQFFMTKMFLMLFYSSFKVYYLLFEILFLVSNSILLLTKVKI